jgi:UDP-perosamine 4-acetyltransferase
MPAEPTLITVPQLGVNEDIAVLIEWHIPDEGAVQAGDRICTLETSKAVFDVEAERHGVLGHLAAEGGELAINTPLAVIADGLEAVAAAKADYLPPPPQEDAAAERTVKATEPARKLAEELGIDLATVKSRGIVREHDVRQAHAQANSETAAGPEELDWDESRVPVVVYGAGRGAVTLSECLDLAGTHLVACFVDDRSGARISLEGKPVFHSSQLPEIIARGVRSLAIAVANAEVRLRIRRQCDELDIELINAIHPRAWISPSARMGRGNYIKAGALVDTGCRIGDCCIIDNRVAIPHDNTIGDGCHLAPGVHLGSNVIVGERSILGIGASVSTNVRIGRDAIVSVGSAVTQDVPDEAVVEGVPAKVVGRRGSRR